MTSGMLELAKPFARDVLTKQRLKLQRHFCRFASRKYKCKSSQVSFRHEASMKRMRRAELLPVGEELLGLTDGESIWISSEAPMTWDDLVCTLVHETLHDYCTVRGKIGRGWGVHGPAASSRGSA